MRKTLVVAGALRASEAADLEAIKKAHFNRRKLDKQHKTGDKPTKPIGVSRGIARNTSKPSVAGGIRATRRGTPRDPCRARSDPGPR